LLRRQVTKAGRGTPTRQLADWAAIIESNSARAAALVDEVLDIARLEAGQTLDLDRRPTDLVALAGRMVAEYQRDVERHRITVDAPVPSLVGPWDGGRLARVLDNLLGNAIKYSPEGGEIGVRVTQDGPWALLTVSDEGVGIPAADRSRIFEHLQRGANVAGHVGGTGVGLAFVRCIVELHGGTVTVASEEGVGSTFTVRLPLA
jgi:signal transduction histidine kinase